MNQLFACKVGFWRKLLPIGSCSFPSLSGALFPTPIGIEVDVDDDVQVEDDGDGDGDENEDNNDEKTTKTGESRKCH